MPAGLDPTLEIDIHNQTRAAIHALGIDNSAVNLDIFICDDQAYIVEVGARAGGGACLPESVSTFFGFNHYENIINAALGQIIEFNYSKPSPNAARMLFSDKAGILTKLDYEDISHPDLIGISFDYWRKGARIH